MARTLRALRGAITLDEDSRDQVLERTARLVEEMMARNEVVKDDLVSVIFTATVDIRSEFPAVAARAIGISDVPLLCTSELDIEGSLPLCVRVLMHLYTERDASSLRHVYLEGARPLRTDLPQ